MIWNIVRRLRRKVIKGKGRYSSSWEPHLRATGRHLPYAITQCYLPPDTSERAPPNPSHAGWYSIYLPRRDGRLSWLSWLDSAPAGSRTSDLWIMSPTPNRFTTKTSTAMLTLMLTVVVAVRTGRSLGWTKRKRAAVVGFSGAHCCRYWCWSTWSGLLIAWLAPIPRSSWSCTARSPTSSAAHWRQVNVIAHFFMSAALSVF